MRFSLAIDKPIYMKLINLIRNDPKRENPGKESLLSDVEIQEEMRFSLARAD